MRRVGFVGCYSHDVILMLAKILGCMDRKVLVRDCNKRHILRASIPIPENIGLEKEETEYDGVFFTEQSATEATARYEIELIDFGVELKSEDKKCCTDWVVVTDMLLHHIRRLEELEFPREDVRACVVRDSFEDICEGEPEIRRFLSAVPNAKVFFLPPDFRDVRNRYLCETSHEYSVNRASPEMQNMIYGIAGMLCGNYSEKGIKRRMKQLERRRYR